MKALGRKLYLIQGKPHLDEIETVMDGFSEDQPESETSDVNLNSAVYKVRQAISSPEHFESLYLELSELAMASFKILDRDRSAAIIGGEVASFYFKRENYEKAEIKAGLQI